MSDVHTTFNDYMERRITTVFDSVLRRFAAARRTPSKRRLHKLASAMNKMNTAIQTIDDYNEMHGIPSNECYLVNEWMYQETVRVRDTVWYREDFLDFVEDFLYSHSILV